MALFSFSTPTDKEILLDLVKESESRLIQFVGSGCFSQKIERVKFSRKFILKNGDKEEMRQVVYIKKGRNWKLLEIVSVEEGK